MAERLPNSFLSCAEGHCRRVLPLEVAAWHLTTAKRMRQGLARGCFWQPHLLSNILPSACHAAAQVQLQMSQEALRKSEERLRAAARERQDSVEGRSRR